MPTPLGALHDMGAPVSPESAARWARGTPKSCIVFVHGYGGRALGTWGEFPDLAMEDAAFEKSDLVFLGYDSRARTAAYSAGVIYRAVSLLAEDLSAVLKTVGGPEREPGFSYDEIVLVGHSLGGALVRDVAMSAKNAEKPWAENVALALFAPAHLGAKVIQLATISTGFLRWSGLPQAMAYVASPVLQDLTPRSDYINSLLTKAQQIGVHCTTKSKLVVHAADDDVVDQNPFFRDDPCCPYANKTHVSCCKPKRGDFDLPVKHLARLIG